MSWSFHNLNLVCFVKPLPHPCHPGMLGLERTRWFLSPLHAGQSARLWHPSAFAFSSGCNRFGPQAGRDPPQIASNLMNALPRACFICWWEVEPLGECEEVGRLSPKGDLALPPCPFIFSLGHGQKGCCWTAEAVPLAQGVLKPAHFQSPCQGGQGHTGSWKSALVGIFTPWKWAVSEKPSPTPPPTPPRAGC